MDAYKAYNFSMDDSVHSDISHGSETTSGDSAGNDSHQTPRSRAVVTKGSGQFRRVSSTPHLPPEVASETSGVVAAAAPPPPATTAARRMSGTFLSMPGDEDFFDEEEPPKRHSTIQANSFMETNARSSMMTIASDHGGGGGGGRDPVLGVVGGGNSNNNNNNRKDVQNFTADLYDEFASRARGRSNNMAAVGGASSSTLRYLETRNQFNDIDQSVNLMFHEMNNGSNKSGGSDTKPSIWSRMWPSSWWSSSSSSSSTIGASDSRRGQFNMKDTSMEDIRLDGTMYSVGPNNGRRRRSSAMAQQHHSKSFRGRDGQLRKKAQWWCLHVFLPMKILCVLMVILLPIAYLRYKEGAFFFHGDSIDIKENDGNKDDGVTNNQEEDDGASSSSVGPTITILPPTGDIRIETISQKIRDMGLTGKNELNNLHSIPFYALRWISDVDEAMLAVNDDQLLQRYALAVLCYTILPSRLAERHSSGEYWVMDHHRQAQEQQNAGGDYLENWLSSKHICEWKGVECSQQEEVVVEVQGNETQSTTVLSMTGLYLNHSSIQGTIPGELRALTDLQVLDLSYNQLTGSIPELMSNGFGMKSLEFLKLDNNELDGTMPTFDGQEHLANIYLHRNNLLGGLHLPHASLALVEELQVQHNNLHGSIPADIEKMTKLKQLRLDNNLFHDKLPTFSQMSNMEVLTMEKNRFSGTVPSHWSKMHHMKSLSLGSNQLSGELPFALHKMTDLEHLWIADNAFTGQIPGFIGQMTSLVSIFLQDNQFTGTIPETFGDLTSAYSFHAFGNQLEGAVPDSVCMLMVHDALVDLKMDCATGNITCSCCTNCY